MKIELIKANETTIGWKMVAENEEDRLRLGSIRNIQFYGFDDTAIEYNGVIPWKEDEKYVQELSWKQKQFIK